MSSELSLSPSLWSALLYVGLLLSLFPPCLNSSTTLTSYTPSNPREKGESKLLTFPTKVLDSLTLNDLTLIKSPPFGPGEDMTEGKIVL